MLFWEWLDAKDELLAPHVAKIMANRLRGLGYILSPWFYRD
jgi:hypothetical protein